MQLARMDDVAGCRLIFEDVESLSNFRNSFHASRFDHRLRNEIDKYDYIKRPKNTGYRGIHDVYEYHVRSITGQHLAGLNIEIQYRTKIQHAWATAVEVVGFITESQPKFQKGDSRYQHAMALASEILARTHESLKGCFMDITNDQLIKDFLKIDKELRLLKTLGGLNIANSESSDRRNSILIFSGTGDLEIRSFRDATDALRALFELEKQHPDRDIVLVRADSSEEVRFAFKNYFSDAHDFINLVEQGCGKLSNAKVVHSRKQNKMLR